MTEFSIHNVVSIAVTGLTEFGSPEQEYPAFFTTHKIIVTDEEENTYEIVLFSKRQRPDFTLNCEVRQSMRPKVTGEWFPDLTGCSNPLGDEVPTVAEVTGERT